MRCLRSSATSMAGAPHERRAVRQEKSKPLLDDMHAWLLRERETLSRSSEVMKPMNYMLRRWDDFARFLDDGRICLTNNAAERALRGIALGRRNWTFAGCQRGADRAAIMLTMITTCRLNDVDPKAWLADVVQATGRDHRQHDGGAVSATQAAGEGPVAPSQGDAAQRSFGGVVAEADPAIVEEAGEVVPAPEHVIHRLQDLGGAR